MSNNFDKSKMEKVYQSSTIKQQSSSGLGVTPTYNKENRDKLWDSTKDKREYKEDVFGKKNTYYDPYTNQLLHKNENAAKKKYHMKNKSGENISKKWANHSSEVDHIIPLKTVHQRAKNNPFLTDADIKKAANQRKNYRLISKQANTSKGKKSDWGIIFDKYDELTSSQKMNLIKEKLNAEFTVTSSLTLSTGKNISKEFNFGAKEAIISSAIPLVVDATKQMCSVLQGEEDFSEAILDIGSSTGKIAITGGANKIFSDTGEFFLEKLKDNEIFPKEINNDIVQDVLVLAMLIKDFAIEYIEGEITSEEFTQEVIDSGCNLAVGKIGGKMGRNIGKLFGSFVGTIIEPGAGTAIGSFAGEKLGEFLGVLISTIACSAVISTYRSIDSCIDNIEHKLTQLKNLEEIALEEIKKQQQKFESIVKSNFVEMNSNITKGFNLIYNSFFDETTSVECVTEGVDIILKTFGKSVAFNSTEEYLAQLDEPLILNIN